MRWDGFEVRKSPGLSGGFLGGRGLAFDDAHDVALLHDEEFVAVDGHFGARPLAEQDLVAGFHVERNDLAALVARAGSNGDHFAFLRLLLDGVGDDDPPFRTLFRVDAFDDDAVVERTELHAILLSFEPNEKAGFSPARDTYWVVGKLVQGRKTEKLALADRCC